MVTDSTCYEVQFDAEDYRIVFGQDAVDRLESKDGVASAIKLRPEWSQYAGLGYVPAQVLVDAGWWIDCSGCIGRVCPHGEGIDEDGENCDPVFDGNKAWCSEKCRRKEHARHVRFRRTQWDAVGELLAKCPRAFFVRCFTGSVGGDYCFDTCKVNVTVEFKFPGSRIDTAAYCHGCKTIRVCKGDVEAWRQLVPVPSPVSASRET